MAGTLYVVATPIGNLEDISLRALRILKEVHLIAAEDTRHTRILLDHYGIHTPLTSYHEHNEKSKTLALVARLIEGESVALVSDAGTPLLSDPGYRLVREAIKAGIHIVPVPGASALTAVLSVCGLPMDGFVFEGFLPAKRGERIERLMSLREEPRTLVFYEVPHRIDESLQDLLTVLGDREVVVGREVTKLHEEFIRGRLMDVIARGELVGWRGEITLVVKGPEQNQRPSRELLLSEIRKLRNDGLRIKEIAEVLGKKFSYSKRDIYRLALEEKT